MGSPGSIRTGVRPRYEETVAFAPPDRASQDGSCRAIRISASWELGLTGILVSTIRVMPIIPLVPILIQERLLHTLGGPGDRMAFPRPSQRLRHLHRMRAQGRRE